MFTHTLEDDMRFVFLSPFSSFCLFSSQVCHAQHSEAWTHRLRSQRFRQNQSPFIQSESKPGRQIIRQRYKITRQSPGSINKVTGHTLTRKHMRKEGWNAYEGMKRRPGKGMGSWAQKNQGQGDSETQAQTKTLGWGTQ